MQIFFRIGPIQELAMTFETIWSFIYHVWRDKGVKKNQNTMGSISLQLLDAMQKSMQCCFKECLIRGEIIPITLQKLGDVVTKVDDWNAIYLRTNFNIWGGGGIINIL